MRIALALFLAGCTNLDPSYGAIHVEQPSSGTDMDSGGGRPPAKDAATLVDGDAAQTLDADATSSDDAPDDIGAPEAQTGISFRRDIRPLLNRAANDPTGKGCKNCHYSTEPNHPGLDLGGIDLATLGAIREGGGSTGKRIIVPGKPDESGFIQKLRGTYPYGTRMPKNGPPYWSDADVKIVSDWIAQGAKGADDE
jgi:hypothetical protein